MRQVVVLVGGGVFLPRLAESLAAAAVQADLELRLVGRDPDRLGVVSEHLRQRLARHRPSWTVVPSRDLAAALEGARAVVLLARIGGLEARAADEALAARFGHAPDEGLGIGGLANAWRTLPWMERTAKLVRSLAADCAVLGLMAPLGATTRVLCDAGLRAVGLCELPIATLRRFTQAEGGAPRADELKAAGLGYAGFNHLGFFWPTGSAGQALLERSVDLGRIDRPTFDRYGAAPLDYHYRVLDPSAGSRLGRRAPEGRARSLIELREHALGAMHAEPGAVPEALGARPTPWFDLALVPALLAVLGGEPYHAPLDARNGAALPFLPEDAVVELPGELRGEGRPRFHSADPPATVREFLESLARFEELLYRSARERDPALVRAALEAWPVPTPREHLSALCDAITRPTG